MGAGVGAWAVDKEVCGGAEAGVGARVVVTDVSGGAEVDVRHLGSCGMIRGVGDRGSSLWGVVVGVVRRRVAANGFLCSACLLHVLRTIHFWRAAGPGCSRVGQPVARVYRASDIG